MKNRNFIKYCLVVIALLYMIAFHKIRKELKKSELKIEKYEEIIRRCKGVE